MIPSRNHHCIYRYFCDDWITVRCHQKAIFGQSLCKAEWGPQIPGEIHPEHPF